MALNRQACPSAPVTWLMYFSMYLYIDALGDSNAEENDLPEKDLAELVGKSTEKGTVTKTSELRSGIGMVRSMVKAIPETNLNKLNLKKERKTSYSKCNQR